MIQFNNKSQARQWVCTLTSRVHAISETTGSSQYGIRAATLPGGLHQCTLALMEECGSRLEEVVGFESNSEVFDQSKAMADHLSSVDDSSPSIITVNGDFMDMDVVEVPKSKSKTKNGRPKEKLSFDMGWYDAEESASDVKFRRTLKNLHSNGDLMFKRAWSKELPGLFFCSHALNNLEPTSKIGNLADELVYFGSNYSAGYIHKVNGGQSLGIEAVHRVTNHGLFNDLNNCNESLCDFVNLGSSFYSGSEIKLGKQPKLMHIAGFAVIPRLHYSKGHSQEEIDNIFENLKSAVKRHD